MGYGLDSLVFSAGGDIRVLGDDQVPAALRAAGLRSIRTLYAEVFAPRLRAAHPGVYTFPRDLPPVGHPLRQLAYVCYMFWDIAPIMPGSDITREVLKVLEATLALDSIACQEAALHGLGHWQGEAPGEVGRIVNEWLQTHPATPDDLRAYAIQASAGRVM